MSVHIEAGYGYPDEIAMLFSEYTDMLVENDPEFAKYLDKQNYDEELKHPEGKYRLPYGRLYIALDGDRAVGCAALRRIDEESCEIKRLYVRSEYRKNGLGRRLAEKIVADAKSIGYKRMLLDTLPFLKNAIALYKSMGFYEIESYNNSPMKGLIYMRLDLQGGKS